MIGPSSSTGTHINTTTDTTMSTNTNTGTAHTGTSATSPLAASVEWPLWEVFVRARSGLEHKHCGSLHAPDAAMAIQLAREVYARRQEGTSIWVLPSSQITASDPGDKDMYFDPMEDKVYRHPTFYVLPEAVNHM